MRAAELIGPPVIHVIPMLVKIARKLPGVVIWTSQMLHYERSGRRGLDSQTLDEM